MDMGTQDGQYRVPFKYCSIGSIGSVRPEEYAAHTSITITAISIPVVVYSLPNACESRLVRNPNSEWAIEITSLMYCTNVYLIFVTVTICYV